MLNDFISVLRNSQIQAHIWHNQTEGDYSFSEHNSLGFYYEGIGELVDELVESIQGIYPRIRDYKPTPSYPNWVSCDDTIMYFKTLYNYVQSERTSLPQESWIQNQIDEVAQHVATTLYKLSLK